MAILASATRFPRWVFNPLNKAPLALRLGALAQHRLAKLKQPKLVKRETSSFRYVTMAGRDHWLLLRESLVSLHRSWTRLPQVSVVSDGSWEEPEFRRYFDFWPEPIQTVMPSDVLGSLRSQYQLALVELAQLHPLGLKLAAIVLFGRTSPILFVDSDILWFSQPILPTGHGLLATVESGCSYNPRLLEAFVRSPMHFPGINTGCVYLYGELCPDTDLQAMLKLALNTPQSEEGYNFNEQTIIALATNYRGRVFDHGFCVVDFEDAFWTNHKKSWQDGANSRHYVNWMRHQFYRDALELRTLADS